MKGIWAMYFFPEQETVQQKMTGNQQESLRDRSQIPMSFKRCTGGRQKKLKKLSSFPFVKG